MSILDSLRNRRNTFSSARYNAALDDVREALLHPTDEQVEHIDSVWHDSHYPIYDTITGQFRCACGEAPTDLHRIRVYLAAAAGGER